MKLGLGTVQFGYEGGGACTAEARVTQEEIRRILELARNAGLRLVDTSAQAGRSQEFIGQCMPEFPEFQLLSRVPVFEAGEIASRQAEQMEHAMRHTLETLRVQRLYGVLFQHPADLLAEPGKRLLKRMQGLQQQGLIDKIGVSVSHAAEIDRVLRVFVPDIVQLPLNIFDQRLLQGCWLQTLKSEGVEVHARSIFLQGVLLEPTHPHPWFWPIRKRLQDYHNYLVAEGLTPMEAAISFIAGIPEVDYALVGVSSARHLQEILDAYALRATDCDFSRFAVSEEKYINPALWNLYG